MRSRIQPVREPALLPHRSRDPESILLREDEGFEVVEHDRLIETLEMLQREGLQQQRVAPDACREARHRGRRTTQAPGDLAMRTTGNQTGGDR